MGTPTCRLPLLILCLLPLIALSQGNYNKHVFQKVDSFARTVKYEKDIYKLAKQLTDNYTTDLDKARSIFIWITENIEYDIKLFNKGEKAKNEFKCKPGENCEAAYKEWQWNGLKNVLKKGKAICSGYATLFQTLCTISGLRVETVAGYTKQKPFQIGMTGSLNHAWNVIWLDSAYYNLDPTWAAGYCLENETDGSLVKFFKHYNDYYWLTPFNDFARNHYPKDGKWVLEANYTKQKFADNPYYDPKYLSTLRLITPETGMLKVKKGDTLRFKLQYSGYLDQLQINTNVFRNLDIYKRIKTKKAESGWLITHDGPKEVKIPKGSITEDIDTLALKKQKYVSFKKTGDIYEFEYPVNDQSLYYIEVLFNHRRVLRFKVKVEDPG